MTSSVRRRPKRSERKVTSSVPRGGAGEPETDDDADGLRVQLDAGEIDAEQHAHHAGGERTRQHGGVEPLAIARRGHERIVGGDRAAIDISIIVVISYAPMKTANVIDALGALAHEYRLAIYRLLVEQGPAGLAAGVIG